MGHEEEEEAMLDGGESAVLGREGALVPRGGGLATKVGAKDVPGQTVDSPCHENNSKRPVPIPQSSGKLNRMM